MLQPTVHKFGYDEAGRFLPAGGDFWPGGKLAIDLFTCNLQGTPI